MLVKTYNMNKKIKAHIEALYDSTIPKEISDIIKQYFKKRGFKISDLFAKSYNKNIITIDPKKIVYKGLTLDQQNGQLTVKYYDTTKTYQAYLVVLNRYQLISFIGYEI